MFLAVKILAELFFRFGWEFCIEWIAAVPDDPSSPLHSIHRIHFPLVIPQ